MFLLRSNDAEVTAGEPGSPLGKAQRGVKIQSCFKSHGSKPGEYLMSSLTMFKTLTPADQLLILPQGGEPLPLWLSLEVGTVGRGL